MHVSPVEREVHGTEHFLEIALGTQVQSACACVGCERLSAVEICVIVVAHGLEHRHIELGKMRAHCYHTGVGIPVSFGIHDIAKRHSVARQ